MQHMFYNIFINQYSWVCSLTEVVFLKLAKSIILNLLVISIIISM